jgi:hypothetical protein
VNSEFTGFIVIYALTLSTEYVKTKSWVAGGCLMLAKKRTFSVNLWQAHQANYPGGKYGGGSIRITRCASVYILTVYQI